MRANAPDDAELLRRYAERQCEESFGLLVERHVGLVYSAAVRQLGGDRHAAQDVTQAVFVELSRRAAMLARHPALVGWFYTTTHHLVCRALRTDLRRTRREQEAHAMQRLDHGDEPDGRTLRPILDDAMRDLRERDRNAVLLRFFEGRDLRSVGAALGVSEDAARMRIERALDRLRSALQRRGITTTSAMLATSLATHAVETLPAGLAGGIVASTLAHAGALGVAQGLAGILPQAFTPVVMMKSSLALASAIAVLSAVPLVIQYRQVQAADAILTGIRQEAADIPGIQEEHDQLAAKAALAAEIRELSQGSEELARLRQEAAQIREFQASPRFEEFLQARELRLAAEADRDREQEQTEFRELHEKALSAIKQLGIACRIYAGGHEERFPDSFEAIADLLGTNEPGGLPLDRFEIYPQPRVISEMEPQLFLVREKEPRRRVDGGWERIYGLADGSAQTLESETQDFSEVERSRGGIAPAEIPDHLRESPAYRPRNP